MKVKLPIGRESGWLWRSERILGCLVGVCVIGFLLFVAPRLPRSHPAKPAGAPADSVPLAHLPPPVAFDPDVLDAGKLLQNETVTRTFRLRNRSEIPLRLVALRTSCACTFVNTNLLREVLERKGEILVPVRFDSDGRSGPITAIVEVVLRAGTTNYVVVGRLEAEVIPDFSYEPRNVQFGRLSPGERATETVIFRPRALQDLVLTSTQSWRGPFEVKVQGLLATVTFHAPAITHGETYSQVMHVRTSSPRVPQVTLSISGQVVPEVEVIPSALVFAAGEPAGVSRLTVRALDPCGVIRLVKVGLGGQEALPLVPADEVSLSEWSLAHALVITNWTVAGADRLEVEVRIQNGAGRSEARLASVDIKRLVKPKQETKP